MNVLILSITAGQGHHSAAKSISDALTDIGANVNIVDVYKEIDNNLCDAVNKGYLFSTKYTPKAYRTIYELIENKETVATKYSIQSIMSILLAIRFEKFIEDYRPDAIICTHIFAAQIINELKRRDKFSDVPAIGIVTDYTIHPFWEDVTYIEYIEIASELLIHRANKKGIGTERLCPFGIPVQKKFSHKLPRDKARDVLSLKHDLPVVLVMAGSMGYGDMPVLIEDIQRFDENCQIIAVCGNNTKLLKRLTDNEYGENVRLYGFTSEVDVLMDAADCIVTKPGGLTTTEAMAKRLPMILVTPIPGQEERNMEFFMNNGIALSVTKTFTVDEALYYLFNTEGRLEQMDRQLAAIAKPDAAVRLAAFTEELIKKKQIQQK